MRRSLLALLLLLAPSSALAEPPQILALVQTPVPVELNCGTDCRAELTTFCLQEGRRAPRSGTPYRLARGAPVALLARFPDGRIERLAAEGHVMVRSLRHFSAVEVRVPTVPEGAVALALEVGADATLLPAGERHDAATRALRAVGRRVVESETHLVALGATNALINAVSTEGGPSEAGAIWAQAVAGRFAGADARGLAVARRAFDDCTGTMARADGEAARVCLGLRHDSMVDGLTHDYWAAVRTGS